MFGGNDTAAKPPSRRRVLKPPGGGSSDIFGTTAHEPEPQRKAKNHHLTSSIFSGEDAQTPARKAGNDSFYNLFGTESQNQSRPGTAVKDKFKSNIVLDDNTLDAKKSLMFSEDGCRTESDNGMVLLEPESVNGAGTNGVHKNGTEIDVEDEEPTQATTNGEKAETAVNGSSSASSTASTPAASAPAPAPAQTASAAASRQRVPPGGFSSGLW